MLDLVDALRGVGTSLHIIVMAMSPILQLLNAFSKFNVSSVDFIITLLQDETCKSYDSTRDIVESILRVFPAPVGAHLTTSFPAYRFSTICIWNQHVHLPNFASMSSQINLAVGWGI